MPGKYLSMNLGIVIERLRKERGLKQYELANLVGISATSMSLIENNKHHPEHATMIKIANTLEVPLPIVYILSLDHMDIAPDKLPAFWAVVPGVKVLLESLY